MDGQGVEGPREGVRKRLRGKQAPPSPHIPLDRSVRSRVGRSLEPPMPLRPHKARRGELREGCGGPRGQEGCMPALPLGWRGEGARATPQNQRHHVPDGGCGPSASSSQSQELRDHQAGTLQESPHDRGGINLEHEGWRQGDAFLSGWVRGGGDEQPAHPPLTGGPQGASSSGGVAPGSPSRQPDEAPEEVPGGSSHPPTANPEPSSRGDAASHDEWVGEVPPQGLAKSRATGYIQGISL